MLTDATQKENGPFTAGKRSHFICTGCSYKGCQQVERSQLQNDIKDLQDKIEITDKEIDQMVYELYSLTEDETEIVEKETQ